MAKLSAHGVELGRIQRVAETRAYFSDGTILKNSGFGWKVQGKVKPGFDPATVYQNRVDAYKKLLDENPAFKRWHALITQEPLNIRWKLLSSMELLGDDIDGIWSTLDDDSDTRGRYSVEDLQELCNAMESSNQEYKEKKSDKCIPK